MTWEEWIAKCEARAMDEGEAFFRAMDDLKVDLAKLALPKSNAPMVRSRIGFSFPRAKDLK